MPTFVSMVRWTGEPQPLPADVRKAIADRESTLADAGLRSIVFLPDEGACCAIMVASCNREPDVERLASAILRDATVRIESIRFDDRTPEPRQCGAKVSPPPPPGYLGAVLEAIESVQPRSAPWREASDGTRRRAVTASGGLDACAPGYRSRSAAACARASARSSIAASGRSP